MLNQQEPWKIDRDPNGSVLVHSIFRTIQGEGPFAGHPAVFIRLAGCNLQCPGCDTEYTSKSKLAFPRNIVDILPSFYDWPTHEDLLVVITGGEPFRQNITPTVRALLDHGYKVQIESNGLLYPGDDFPWGRTHENGSPEATVVVSPKTGKIHPKTAQLATAYKYVLAWDSVAPDGLPEMALGHPLGGASTIARPPAGWDGPVYVQPMDHKDDVDNRRSMRAVVDTVMKHPNFIMGVQMHKLTGLP